MRNKQLFDLLSAQAYERGHYAGEKEVENILQALIHDFAGIDNLLPYTMPPKFEVGQVVYQYNYGSSGRIDEVIKNDDGYTYKVEFPEFGNIAIICYEQYLSFEGLK